MEYDNTNTGAVWQAPNAKLVGTGTLNDDGKENRICIVKEQQKDGKDVRDIYIKVGRMWDNDNPKENAPARTGQIDLSSGDKRIAAWIKTTDNGSMLSLNISEKQVDNSLSDDDIPF